MMPTGTVNATALTDRVKNILLTPKTEWPVIEAETTDVGKLYREYIVLLAAIPAIAGFIGTSIIGVTLPFIGTYRIPMMNGLAHMIVAYVLGLVGVYVSAIVIDKLAPTFDSTSNSMQALKLVAYASTPAWVAGILQIIPALGILGILAGLYSIYLFYLGLPVQMKTPQAKVIPYMVVAALVIIVVYVVVGVLATVLTGASIAGSRF